MTKNQPPDSERTISHNVPLSIDMDLEINNIQGEMRKQNPSKPKRPKPFIMSDRIHEALQAREIIQSDEENDHEKMRSLYKIFSIPDPLVPVKDKRK